MRLGAAFDDLYDDDEQEEDEEQPLPPPKKEKGKKAGIKFADGDGASGEEKEKLTPGTPFVKMGGGFDDLYDEDEDEEKESDEEDEPSPVPKKDKSRKTCFTEDTKDEEGGLRQPG